MNVGPVCVPAINANQPRTCRPWPYAPEVVYVTPLEPVPAHIVPGASGFNASNGGDTPRREPFSLSVSQGPGSEIGPLLRKNGTGHRRETNEARSAAMTLMGVSGGSTTEAPYSRDRRDRAF